MKRNRLNEFLGGTTGDVGLIVQGGIYNALNRAMVLLGLDDEYGNSDIPIYCLNVAYPLIEDELVGFCADKKAVLVIEEGQPEYLEQNIASILSRKRIGTHIHGKDVLPLSAEYTSQIILGSGLVDQSQKSTVAAKASAEKNTVRHRSYRVATRR